MHNWKVYCAGGQYGQSRSLQCFQLHSVTIKMWILLIYKTFLSKFSYLRYSSFIIHFPLGLKGILFNCDVTLVRYGSKCDGMTQQQWVGSMRSHFELVQGGFISFNRLHWRPHLPAATLVWRDSHLHEVLPFPEFISVMWSLHYFSVPCGFHKRKRYKMLY